MIYRKFPPSPPLRPYVECYYIWEGELKGRHPATFESPPSGFASIVFNYGGESRVTNRQYREAAAIPRFFLAGQATGRYELTLTERIAMAGIVFRPTGLAALFGLPMFELTEERLNLADVLAAGADRLAEQIAEAPTQAAKAGAMDRFLLRQLTLVPPEDDPITRAAALIVKRDGLIGMDELLGQVFMSRRTFERRFLEKVGVSPRYYARIRRIANLCFLLTHRRESDWQSLIMAGDFYDQAHFIKEFRHFMEVPPSQYFRHNRELVQFLEKEELASF